MFLTKSKSAVVYWESTQLHYKGLTCSHSHYIMPTFCHLISILPNLWVCCCRHGGCLVQLSHRRTSQCRISGGKLWMLAFSSSGRGNSVPLGPQSSQVFCPTRAAAFSRATSDGWRPIPVESSDVLDDHSLKTMLSWWETLKALQDAWPWSNGWMDWWITVEIKWWPLSWFKNSLFCSWFLIDTLPV